MAGTKGKSNISIDNIVPQGHFTTGTRISNPSPHFVHGKKLAHALGLTVSDLLRPLNGTLDPNTLVSPARSDD